MARSKDELREYIKALGHEKNLPDDKINEVLSFYDDAAPAERKAIADLFTPIVDQVVGRHSDYSKAMDDVRKKKAGVEADHKRLTDWYADAQTRIAGLSGLSDANLEKIRKYEELYGQIEEIGSDGKDSRGKSGGGTNVGNNTALSMEEVDKRVEAAKKEALMSGYRLTADLEKLRFKHAKTFKGEILDGSAVMQRLGEAANEGRSITAEEAYSELFGEKIAAVQADAAKSEAEKYREEGRKEARAAAAKNFTRSGANVPENDGPFWGRMQEEGKQQETSTTSTTTPPQAAGSNQSAPVTRAANDIDAAALFVADFQNVLASKDE